MIRRAFSLMEVLIAIALLGVLAGAVAWFIWDLIESRSQLQKVLAELQAGDAIVERLETDLFTGLAGNDRDGSGVQGSATDIRVLSRSVWLSVADANAGSLQGTHLQFSQGSGEVALQRWTGQNPGTDREVVATGVQRLRFRYFDGREWTGSFDALAANALPAAVEVAIWFGPPIEDEFAPPEPEPETTRSDSGFGMGAMGDDVFVTDDEPDDTIGLDADRQWREPDRLRVIVIPDGPEAAWGSQS